MTLRGLGLVALLGVAATACSDDTVTVDVFAASSLTDAFTIIEHDFEADNPGIDIRLNLAGSDTLRRQIDEGADADVFAPASIDLFDGLGLEPTAYASNQLDVVVHDLAAAERFGNGDLDGLLVARCAPGVPCGDATDRLIAAAGIDLSGAVVTSEANVRAVLTKVDLGEADLGFVYRTDAMSAEDVVVLGIGGAESRVVLAVAALGSPTSGDADAFVEYVASRRDVFDSLGFDPAP